MTVEEMQAQLDKMKDDIAHMKVKVSECEHMISMIKAQDDEPKFERVPKTKIIFRSLLIIQEHLFTAQKRIMIM